MRKGLAVFLIFVFMISSVGCGRQETEAEASDGRLRIVCTVFPVYDWVKEILGGRAEETELTLLMKNGADLHSYQPTVWDMKKIAEADLFLYVGGESDFWVEDALAGMEHPGRRVMNLMDILGYRVLEEEHLEGMQTRPGAGEHESHEAEYDEHVWLSLRNAKEVCRAVTEELCGLEKEQESLYRDNLLAYEAKLDALDEEYQKAVDTGREPTLLFGDRFPFCYLAEDYGITCYAAFAGCSAETEASFSTITFLAEKAGELNLPVILSIDGSDRKISRTIAANTSTGDQKVLVLDSMQSVSEADIEKGESYLGIMERNLEVLKEALGAGAYPADTEL